MGVLLYFGDMAHFQTTRRVEFHDTDLAGIIHFSNYFLYMEEAEHELFRSLGLKIHAEQPDGVTCGWPRVSASASFSKPAYYEDRLEVRVTILRLGPRSLTTGYEFWRDGEQLAQGEMKTAYCRVIRPGQIESQDIPADIAARLDALRADVAPSGSA